MAKLDAVFHSRADITRRAVSARLAEGPASVSDLAAPHAMALQSVLISLPDLKAGGIIVTAKHGRGRACGLRPEAVRAAWTWLGQRRDIRQARPDQPDAPLATQNDEGPT